MPKNSFQNLSQNRVVLTIAFVLLGLLAVLLLYSPNNALAADDLVLAHQGDGDDCKYRPARGVASVVSENDFEMTLENLRAEITSRPLGIFGEVDHKANAESVDLELRPTTTVIFGNPNIGTQLMQSNQAIGLDLPLKMLVWEDACGVVRIDYNETSFLQKRFKIRDLDNVFDNIGNVLSAIANGAAEASDPYP